MNRLTRAACIAGVHVLYALLTGGTIIAVYFREPITALLFAAARSFLKPMWAELTRDAEAEEEEEDER